MAVKCISEFGADGIQIIRRDAIGDPSPKVHQTGDHCPRRPQFGGQLGKAMAQLGLKHVRNCVKNGQMGGELIALDGEICGAQSIELRLIRGAKRRGQY
jgi:hypothetical protein